MISHPHLSSINRVVLSLSFSFWMFNNCILPFLEIVEVRVFFCFHCSLFCFVQFFVYSSSSFDLNGGRIHGDCKWSWRKTWIYLYLTEANSRRALSQHEILILTCEVICLTSLPWRSLTWGFTKISCWMSLLRKK